MSTDGSCPQCGQAIDVASVSGKITADNLNVKKLAGQENESVPWHFKLLVGLLCIYLGWRVVQLFV